jgi:hypothetical protein
LAQLRADNSSTDISPEFSQHLDTLDSAPIPCLKAQTLLPWFPFAHTGAFRLLYFRLFVNVPLFQTPRSTYEIQMVPVAIQVYFTRSSRSPDFSSLHQNFVGRFFPIFSIYTRKYCSTRRTKYKYQPAGINSRGLHRPTTRRSATRYHQ